MFRPLHGLLFALLLLARPATTTAQVVVASNGTQRLTVSGFVQTQYERLQDSGAPPRDRVFFRRAVLTMEATATRKWAGVLQADFGPAASGGRIYIRDAYLRYTGFEARGITITLGNQKPPFSRSYLASSSRRQLVERPFTGDRTFGSPGRSIGLKVDRWDSAHTRYWSAGVSSALHDPASDALRITGRPEAGAGWDDGVMAAGRFEWHPLGETPREHGAFAENGLRVTAGGAAYLWRNDGDHPGGASGAPDEGAADSVDGFELSFGLRGRRVSIDAEAERIGGRAHADGLTAGLYRDGRARVHKAGIEAGYMVWRRQLELAGTLDVVASPAFPRTWHRAAAGLSWYLDRHAVKLQAMHRVSVNEGGLPGARRHATYLQAQVGF